MDKGFTANIETSLADHCQERSCAEESSCEF